MALWALLTLLECAFPARRQVLFSRQLLTDGVCLVINKWLLRPTFTVLQSLLVLLILQPHVPQLPVAGNIHAWPFAAKFFVAIFVVDLVQYIRHRCTHAFLWSCHATHHSALELRPSVHWRLHPVDLAVIALLDTALLHVLGFDMGIILVAQLFMSLHGMWLHTNLDIGYGPLRKVFASPNYHKWHHGRGKEAIDKNFADLFPIFDIIGGTFIDPQKGKPEKYGVYGLDDAAPLHQHYWGAVMYPFTQWKQLRAAKKAKA